MSFAISIRLPDTADAADHCTDGGLASEPIMLRNVDIMSPLLSLTWNQSLNCSWELSSSKYVLHTGKMKWKEHQQSDFQKQRVSKANPTINFFFFLKLWKFNPIGQNLHHFEVTMEYSREGVVQEISNKESWGRWGQTELVQSGPCEANLPAC
jgi:hypothetical protein